MIDLGIGFNEMQWLVLVIFASIIFFKIGMRAGVEKAIVFFKSRNNSHED